MDLLLEIPGLLEDFDSIPSKCDENPQRFSCVYEDLRARCRLYDDQLQEWSATVGVAVVDFTERLISPETPWDLNSETPSEDFAVAHLGLIYYATCTLLYEIMQQLGVDTDSVRSDPWVYCRKILLLAAYFQRPAMGAMLINFVAFPLGVVVGFCARHEEGASFVSEDVSKSLQRIFQSPHGGHRLRAFLEAWPWQSAAEVRLVTGRTKPRACQIAAAT